MIEDVEQGLVGTVIVKDLSRLGRNYLITGQYTELIFPSYDVRFIAISDNVDSDEGLSDLLPFSNLIKKEMPVNGLHQMRYTATKNRRRTSISG